MLIWWNLGCVCFWVKITFENIFSEMRLYGWSKKFYFLEIEIRWPKKKAFDHENHFTLLFSLQSISGKWERERERARSQSPVRDLAVVDRDLQSAISCRRSQSRIAIDGAIVRQCSVSSLMIFSWVVACVFLDLCFPSSFPNTRKYFPENFLKCNQTPWKHFPFPEISISGKYVFSGKRFPATKHSLIYVPLLSQDPLGEAYGLWAETWAMKLSVEAIAETKQKVVRITYFVPN